MVQTCSHFIENTTTPTINNNPQRKCKKESRKQNRLGEILPPNPSPLLVKNTCFPTTYYLPARLPIMYLSTHPSILPTSFLLTLQHKKNFTEILNFTSQITRLAQTYLDVRTRLSSSRQLVCHSVTPQWAQNSDPHFFPFRSFPLQANLQEKLTEHRARKEGRKWEPEGWQPGARCSGNTEGVKEGGRGPESNCPPSGVKCSLITNQKTVSSPSAEIHFLDSRISKWKINVFFQTLSYEV